MATEMETQNKCVTGCSCKFPEFQEAELKLKDVEWGVHETVVRVELSKNL